jgi:hypothetical protein
MAWDPEGWDQHEDGISAISRHARVTQARARYNVVCMHEYGVRHSVEEPSAAAVTQALNRCICSFGTGYSIVLLPLRQNYSVRSCTVSRSDGRCRRSEKMVRCVMNGIGRKVPRGRSWQSTWPRLASPDPSLLAQHCCS